MSDTLDRLYDLEVSPSEFREALRDVARSMPRKRRAVSLWLRDKDGQLVIDAGVTASMIPAKGEWMTTVVVAASWVRRLAKRLPSGDPIRLHVSGLRLYANRFSEPCSISLEEIPRDPNPPNAGLIPKAAAILEPLLIKREEVEQLAATARARGAAEWSEQEKTILPLIGKAWSLLAPLGVETKDLRRLVDSANRDAWKRADRKRS